jgi:hypothetical protein
MNLVGKIFVVLILIASTVFMTMGMMVYATHQNWQVAVMGANGKGDDPASYHGQLDAAYKDQTKLRGDIDKLQNQLAQERALHTQALVKAENERDLLAKQAATLTADQQKLADRLDKATKDVEIAQQTVTALREADKKLREDIRDANAKTDDQLKIATQTTDKLNVALGQLADLKARNEQLASDFAKAKNVLATLGRTPFDKAEPPMVRGQITAIDKEDRVEISIGSDDGLREGNQLEIYRGNKYLGRMQVLVTEPHRAVGMILKEYKQEPIHSGDEVATKLKA